MSKSVVVIDYGIGNLLSVVRALEYCGADVILSSDPKEILKAPRLVLPGVGAFADGMSELTARGLIDPIKNFGSSGRPLLGICLGMQLLATSSREFGENKGLDLIPGEVIALPRISKDGGRCKVPHIGWSEIYSPEGRSWDRSVLGTSRQGDSVYLVHSFAMQPTDERHQLASFNYAGHQICAAINRDNITGCQFHPEKSGQVGLAILNKFLQC